MQEYCTWIFTLQQKNVDVGKGGKLN